MSRLAGRIFSGFRGTVRWGLFLSFPQDAERVLPIQGPVRAARFRRSGFETEKQQDGSWRCWGRQERTTQMTQIKDNESKLHLRKDAATGVWVVRLRFETLTVL
jgi:hypothetical protein